MELWLSLLTLWMIWLLAVLLTSFTWVLFAKQNKKASGPSCWQGFLWGFLPDNYFIDSWPNLNLLQSSLSMNQWQWISCCWNFLSHICGPIKGTVSPPFCLFWQTCYLINILIDLTRWVTFNTQFIPRLRLIMLPGTESNCGIKFIMWLAVFKPGLALMGFPRTGAWSHVAICCYHTLKRPPSSWIK